MQQPKKLSLRPYQLLCAVCSLGEEGQETTELYNHSQQIRDTIRTNPDLPLTLQCSAGALYLYQDPVSDPDGEPEEYKKKRDLDVLQILGFAPGCTLPARAFFMTLFKGVSTVAGICSYETVTAEAWKGCPKATSGNYERGHARGINALIPARTEDEMSAEKQKSIAALNAATVVTVRPHILLCSVCQYGDGIRPPFKEDNLPELLDIILHRNPDILIQMAPGADWMMCAPCPTRVPDLNCCSHVLGSGELSSQKRDLDTLQKLGLQFGSTMKARELFQLIFERITTSHGVPEICLKYNNIPSVWWDECAEHLYRGNPRAKYEQGRRELLVKLQLS